MPFNGSGTFNPSTPEFPAVDGTPITASDRNALDSDFAGGLTNCLTRDGQSAPTANLPMGNKKFTGLAAGTANGEAMLFEQIGALLPPGIMFDYAGGVVPSAYLLCDGAAHSRTTYAALFAALGGAASPWGAGDGVTTFNVPDFRRRVAVGSGGAATGTLANTVGSVGGFETHTLVSGEMPVHAHGVTDPGHIHSISDPGHTHAYLSASGGGDPPQANASANTGTTLSTTANVTGITINSNGTGISINNAGGGSAHNNIQPSAVVTKIIKT